MPLRTPVLGARPRRRSKTKPRSWVTVALLAATVTLTSLAAPAALTAPAAAAAAVPPSPVVPPGLPAGIESMGSSMSQTTCDPTAKAGTTKLAQLLVATYPGTSTGIGRACTTDTTAVSEHYEGRAVDWMNSVRVAKEAAQADAVIRWLFATDKAGHTYANARRLGVMYVIWNNRIWGAYNADQGWRSYQDCANRPAPSLDSVCHRNHIHISLTWAGAVGSTSYWSKTVAATDYGPCRPSDLNFAPPYSRANPNRCPSYPRVVAPAGSSAVLTALTKDSGKVLKTGTSGAVVSTVQKVVGATADGKYGTQTAARVRTWQTDRGVPATGVVEAATWRALLASQRPAPPSRFQVDVRGSVRRGVR
jgi:hypothetical protein